MSGSLIQLIAKGDIDYSLSTNPDFTYFKSVYKKYINFIIKPVKHPFTSGSPEFGKNNIVVDLSKDGEYMTNIILHIKIESTNSQPLYGKWNYTSNFAFSLLKKVELKIGINSINTIYGNYLQIWYSLFQNKQNKKLIDKLINNEVANEYNCEEKPLSLNIPLPFFYNTNFLPLHNLDNSDISLIFEFNDINKLINKQDKYFNYSNNVNSNPDITNNTYDITLNITESFVITDNIYIDCEHFNLISDNELLYENYFYQESILNLGDNKPKTEIFLKGASKYVIIGIQPHGFINGSKYLASPGKDFYLNAAKRFCLRFAATGWVGGDDNTSHFGSFGIFTNDSGDTIEAVGNLLSFDHGLTSLSKLGKLTEYEKKIHDLFIKLNPYISRNPKNPIITSSMNNITVNISNLNLEDKYILSLPTTEIDNIILESRVSGF